MWSWNVCIALRDHFVKSCSIFFLLGVEAGWLSIREAASRVGDREGRVCLLACLVEFGGGLWRA